MKNKTILTLILIAIFMMLPSCRSVFTAKPQEASNEIDLVDLDGNPFKLSEHKGKKVYIKFWASWCTICLEGMDELEELIAENPDFEIVTIASPGHGSEKKLADFRKWFEGQDYKNIRVLIDEKGELVKKFGVRAYPTSFFVNADGKIKVFPGYIKNAMIKAIFDSDMMNGESAEATPSILPTEAVEGG